MLYKNQGRWEGGQGGKLPGPRGNGWAPWSLKMNFLSPLGMKAEADNSNFNFSQLCDDVSFAGGPVSVIPRAPI